MLDNLFISSDVSELILDFLSEFSGDQFKEYEVNSSSMIDQGSVRQLSDAIGTDSAKARIKQQVLQQLNGKEVVSFADWWQLLETIQSAFSVPALGLKIGQSVKVEHFGCLGYLLKTSQDLKQAIQCFERFQRLLYDGNKAALVFEPIVQGDTDSNAETTKCCNGLQASLVWQAEYGYSSQLSDELLLSGLLKVARTMLNQPDILPLRVEFTNCVDESEHAIYRDFFQCPVLFNQPQLKVSFAAELFSMPIQGSDEQLHQLLSTQAVNLLSTAADDSQHDFLSKLRRVLIRRLQSGEPTADKVAEDFHLSTRSLHRKLQSNGLVFRDVLREVRMTLAKQYLKAAKMSLPEVALMLGYSEQSAFTRAFKSWFNMTPLQYQKSG